MLFTSFSFLLFFAIFWVLYTRAGINVKRLVMFSSLLFYGAWNALFLLLMLSTAVIDYVCARRIVQFPARKRLFLGISITVNLSILAFFKYGGFAGQMANDILALTGLPLKMSVLHVVLPAGLSFYTFQEMAYTIDVYRGKTEPASNFPDFLTYVSFFPQLIAGPIMRPSGLLPQVLRLDEFRRELNGARLGMGLTLLLRGYIKKTLIADHLATYVDPIYASLGTYGFLTIATATFFFALQIYCDFSGYTDIARGLAKLMGVDLMENFNYPYFARNVRDFWSRWHISLSSWIRDYLYIPLGGNRHGLYSTARNIFITMFLCGLWHGANYNFLIWGAYHAILLILLLFWRSSPLARVELPSTLAIACTFVLVLFGWFLFRVNSVEDVILLLRRGVAQGGITQTIPDLKIMLLGGGLLLWQCVEARVLQRRLGLLDLPGGALRAAVATGLVVACVMGRPLTDKVFIYFQF